MASLGIRLFHVLSCFMLTGARSIRAISQTLDERALWFSERQPTGEYWLGSPTVQPHETCLRIAGGDEGRECLFRRMSEFFPLQPFSTSTPLPQISHCAINLEASPHSFLLHPTTSSLSSRQSSRRISIHLPQATLQ